MSRLTRLLDLTAIRLPAGAAWARPWPGGLTAADWQAWVATGFGVGRFRWAPGTAGSLAALPLGLAIQLGFGVAGLWIAAALATLIGLLAVRRIEAAGDHDCGAVVIDEFAGQWIALAALPPTIEGQIAGFLLFRLCDIVKPWPADWCDRRLPGEWGVMLDDVVAGLYAFALATLGTLAFA